MRETSGSELEKDRFAGRYQLLETLGVGGVGTVYRARDDTSAREVALKLLRSSHDDRNRSRQQALFEREFQTLARLEHPRIIQVYEYGVAGDVPYYSMELLEGHDLQQLAPLPIGEACRILRDVATSLALLHAQRLLHRDVSPRNVRRAAGGRAKLIDFGALTSFGIADEIIGTPMCIAPEVLERAPLDQRTDLYALGALAYWAVTGRAAYPARHLRDLPQTWETAPPPPSHWNAEVPAALDTLIMSLLHLDPLARPASAATVIERLSAIATLPPDEDAVERAGESYLTSGRMVGRDRERALLKERMLRALDGKGSDVLLVGPVGIGRSRLLRETCLDATLSALVAIRADAEASPEPYAVPIRLALQLLELAPEIARRAAGTYAGVLSQLSSELGRKLGASPVVLPDDPAERRVRFHDALERWFDALAAELPILVAVDNAQAGDDDSLAFLVGISRAARDRRLVVVVAHRSGGAADRPPTAALRRLRTRSGQLRLRPLDRTACEELLQSIFGEVGSRARLAQLLYERSGGNPRQFMELARQLVETGVARYADGAWTLPVELAQAELPDHPEALAAERLSQLGAAARTLALALSVYRRPLSIERCLALVPERDERETYAALDELVAEQILTATQGSYRFEHAALREAIAASLDRAQLEHAHAQAAELWLEIAETDPSLGARVEAAWHLMAAGEESEGADLLADAQPAFLQSSGPREAVDETVRALERAVAVYTREQRSPRALAGLLFSLVPLAFFVDRRTVRAYGERAVELGLKITGLSLATRLARVLGRRWGLALARWISERRFAGSRSRGGSGERPETIATLCGIVPSVVGVQCLSYDVEAVVRLTRALEPLALFEPRELGSIVYAYACGQLALARGREADARSWLERADQACDDEALRSQLGAAGWCSLRGGISFSLGLLDRNELGAATLERARALEALPLRAWELGADQLRMLHHAQRGESERVGYYRERVDLFAVGSGSTWPVELLAPVSLLSCEVLAQDLLATRRTWEQLARRAADVPPVEVYAEAAHAAYLSLRGEHAAAIARYERLLPRLAAGERAGWSNVRAHFAELLNWAGDHARAKAIAVETLAFRQPAEARVVGRFLELERQLALAEAGLGNWVRATELLDDLLARYGAADQPLLIGLLHKARAEVALQMRDAPELERQLTELDRCFRSTRNPALIAQCERLAERVVREGMRPAAWRAG